jgi:hypothetical protein
MVELPKKIGLMPEPAGTMEEGEHNSHDDYKGLGGAATADNARGMSTVRSLSVSGATDGGNHWHARVHFFDGPWFIWYIPV